VRPIRGLGVEVPLAGGEVEGREAGLLPHRRPHQPRVQRHQRRRAFRGKACGASGRLLWAGRQFLEGHPCAGITFGQLVVSNDVTVCC